MGDLPSYRVRSLARCRLVLQPQQRLAPIQFETTSEDEACHVVGCTQMCMVPCHIEDMAFGFMMHDGSIYPQTDTDAGASEAPMGIQGGSLPG